MDKAYKNQVWLKADKAHYISLLYEYIQISLLKCISKQKDTQGFASSEYTQKLFVSNLKSFSYLRFLFAYQMIKLSI